MEHEMDEQEVIELELNAILEKHEIYLHGHCHIFALALQRLSKLPLFAIVDYDHDIEKQCLVHAGIKSSEGMIDIKGLRVIDEWYDDFDTFEPENIDIEESHLLKLGEGKSKKTKEVESLISVALPVAEHVYTLVQRQIAIIEHARVSTTEDMIVNNSQSEKHSYGKPNRRRI